MPSPINTSNCIISAEDDKPAIVIAMPPLKKRVITTVDSNRPTDGSTSSLENYHVMYKAPRTITNVDRSVSSNHENENLLGNSIRARSTSSDYFSKAWDSGRMSNEARVLLKHLMPECILEKNRPSTCKNISRVELEHELLSSDAFNANKESVHEKIIVDHAMNGKTSVFCAILRTLEKARDSNSDNESVFLPEASFYVPSIALSIRPGDAPAEMGAKEFIYACLAFLCSTKLNSSLTSKLISGHDNTENDDIENSGYKHLHFLEKTLDELFPRGEKPLVEVSYDDSGKHYAITYSLSIDTDRDFKIKVLRLERAFMASSCTLISRIKRMPAFKAGEEKLERYLLISGTTAPPRSVPKSRVPKANVTGSTDKGIGEIEVLTNTKESDDTESNRTPLPNTFEAVAELVTL